MQRVGGGRGIILKLGPAVIALMGLLPGCGWYGDSIPELSRLAVSKQPDGGLTIHYVSCEHERVKRVMLGLSDESFSKDVDTLWRIDSASGSGISTYNVGMTPKGFEAVVSFRDGISSADPISAQVVSSRNGTIPFNLRAEDVPNRGVLQNGDKTQSLPEFKREAAATC